MRYLPLALILLVGCCKPVTISVPPPEPARIVRPELRVKKLTPTSTNKEILEAYVLDLAEQVGYANQLEALIWKDKK